MKKPILLSAILCFLAISNLMVHAQTNYYVSPWGGDDTLTYGQSNDANDITWYTFTANDTIRFLAGYTYSGTWGITRSAVPSGEGDSKVLKIEYLV